MDVVTVGKALQVLAKEVGANGWNPKNEKQKKLLQLLQENWELLQTLSGLKALASMDHRVLNQLLRQEGFEGNIEPLLGSVGVVSIIDKMIEWQVAGTPLDFQAQDGATYKGFQLGGESINVHRVDAYPGSYLLESVGGENTLWLFYHQDPSLEGLEMVSLSFEVMRRRRSTPTRQGWGRYPVPSFEGAILPMVEIDQRADISWLVGLNTVTGDGRPCSVAEAEQMFKFRMNQFGARMKVATTVVATLGNSDEPEPFLVDQPFYGWWTQKGKETLPMGVFFADYDSFREPSGSLGEL